MSFLLKRFSYFENKTYGRLYYESTYLCDTLEGVDMLLEDRLPNTGEVIRKNKDKKIAIPRGTYTLTKIKSNANTYPFVYGLDFFEHVYIADVEIPRNGCICIGTYDYDNGVFVDGEKKLQEILSILEKVNEVPLLIK